MIGEDRVLKVVNEIVEGVRAGRYVPGQRLVTRDFARKLGISSVPVREGFRLLAGDGLLEWHPNSGARVRFYSDEELNEILQIVHAISELAVKLACKNSNRGNYRTTLEEKLKKLRTAHESGFYPYTFMIVKDIFDIIAEMSNNSQIVSFRNKMYMDFIQRNMINRIPEEDFESFFYNIENLCERILHGERARAINIYRRLSVWVVHRLRKNRKRRKSDG